jgi:hypothetical protein
VPAEVSAVVEQVYRRARAQYGDAGGEMLPIKLYEDLTRTPLRHPQRDLSTVFGVKERQGLTGPTPRAAAGDMPLDGTAS